MTVVEVYADIVCPFAHAGILAVVRGCKELGRDDVTLRIRAWPLELVNGQALDRVATAQHVDDLRTQVAADLFSGFNADNFPATSLPALALAAAAYRRDDRVGEAVSLALRDMLFEEGLDVSDLWFLPGRRPLSISVPRTSRTATVRAEWREGQTRGVKGSPHFFCGGFEAFCPSLDISKDTDGQVHVRRNTEAFDAFLAECLTTR